jgi:hypothetical protein
MARSALTIQTVGIAGATISTAAANADGNSIVADEAAKVILQVANGGGSSITVTIPATGKAYGIDLEDQTITVAAGATKHIAGLEPGAFQQTDGTVYVNYSGVSSVTVAAFRIA